MTKINQEGIQIVLNYVNKQIKLIDAARKEIQEINNPKNLLKINKASLTSETSCFSIKKLVEKVVSSRKKTNPIT
jgi:hypothetical protein